MGSTKYQYGAALTANLLAIGHGFFCGWPSAAIALLMSDKSPLPTGSITIGEASTITALMGAGGLFGNLLYGWITERYGRKWPLLSLSIPTIVGWSLILLAQNVNHLYVARFLIGIPSGGIFVIVPPFVAEIADDKIRGALGSIMVLACNFGILLVFIFGHYASYQFPPKFVIALNVLFICAFQFFPESPQCLIKQRKENEAEKSLRFYRGAREDSTDDNEQIQVELVKLRSVHSEKSASNESNKLTLNDFKPIEARKAMMISIVLVILNQVCGCFAMLNYTAKFFAEAGSDLSPNMAAIIVGAIQFLSSNISLILVDRLGRKFLMCVSASGIAFGQSCLGVYLLLQEQGVDVDNFRWVTVASFSFVIFIATMGVLSLPFLIISEILPEKILNFGMTLTMAILSFFAFLMLKIFPYIAEALGSHGSMFLYAGFSLAGALFILFFMPETKGKSFDEIAKLLRK